MPKMRISGYKNQNILRREYEYFARTAQSEYME